MGKSRELLIDIFESYCLDSSSRDYRRNCVLNQHQMNIWEAKTNVGSVRIVGGDNCKSCIFFSPFNLDVSPQIFEIHGSEYLRLEELYKSDLGC